MRNVAGVSKMDHPKDEHLDDEALQCTSQTATRRHRENLSIPADYQMMSMLKQGINIRAYKLLRIARAFRANESRPRLHGM